MVQCEHKSAGSLEHVCHLHKAGQTEFTVYRHCLHRFYDNFQSLLPWTTPLAIEGMVQGQCNHILCHVVELIMAEQLVSVQVTGNNCCIVPWSVVTVDPSSSFDDLIRSLKAGKYSIVSPSEILLQAIIENVAICWKGQTVDVYYW